MKKLFWYFILIMMLAAALSGCGVPDIADESDVKNPAEETEQLLEESLEEVQTLKPPVREYGEPVSYDLLEGKLLARVLYPAGELDAMNTAIEDWIKAETDYYLADAREFVQGETSAELTVEYESWMIQENLVSVRMKGVYGAPFMAHPVDIIKTFNGSLETGKLVQLEKLTVDGGLEVLRDMVAQEAGVEAELIDDGILNHWLLMPEGIEITLVRGDYLPMSEGTKRFTFTYEELEGILDLSKISAPDEPEQPEVSDVPEGEGEDVPEAVLPGENDTGEKPDPDKPMLALTFDDGPSPHTDRLLDAFEKHGGKGTFFVVGNMIHDREETLIRMAESGHEIGGHSWNHRQLTTLHEEKLNNQIMNTRAKIYETTGVDAVLMRPPYGSYNEQVQAKCREYGIAMVNWSVDTLDWKYRDADVVYNSVMNQARDGSIILCHDLHETTVDAMERAIPDLISQGYQLVTVTELLTSQGAEIEAGKMYYKR